MINLENKLSIIGDIRYKEIIDNDLEYIGIEHEVSFNLVSQAKGEYICFFKNDLSNQKIRELVDNIKDYDKRALNIIFLKNGEHKKNYYLNNKESMIDHLNNVTFIVRKAYYLENFDSINIFKNKEIIKRVFDNKVIYLNEGIIKEFEINNNFYDFYKVFNDFIKENNLEEVEGVEKKVEQCLKYLFKEYISYKENILKKNFELLKDLIKKIIEMNINIEVIEPMFINRVENLDFDYFNKLIWYKLKKRSSYNVKIFETYNSEEKIEYCCAWLVFMRRMNDVKMFDEVKFYLYDEQQNKKIFLEKKNGERSFYKYDYPHEEYIYPNDNFRLILHKEKIEEGNYKLKFELLNEENEVIISNPAVARKFINTIYKNKNKLITMQYEVEGKKISLKVKEKKCNFRSKVAIKKSFLLNDLLVIKKINIKNYNLKFLYLFLNFKKKKYKKPLILIGEMPNTYEDSGSVLFEELLKNDRGFEVFFVTTKEELLTKNNRFIKFGSKLHKDLFLMADVLINVQNIDLYMSPFIARNENFSPRKHSKDVFLYLAFSKYLNKQKKIFLQHGVLYQSGLTNGIYVNADFDYLVVSAEFEKNVFPGGHRKFVESGLPRFSRYKKDGYKTKSKKILFSPTWRKYLKDMGKGQVKCNDIVESEYYKRIMSFLCNKELNKMLEDEGYELIYNVHHTLREFLEVNLSQKQFSNNIRLKSDNESLNVLISECDICITDYSSLFFDFLWQGKPVINYVYDYYDFHLRKDNNKKLNEYFNLLEFNNKNICFEEEELLKILKRILKGEINYEEVNVFNTKESLNTFINYLDSLI